MYKPKESNSSTYNAYMNLNFEGNTFIALSDSLLLTHFIVPDYFDCVSWLVTVSNFATKLDFFFICEISTFNLMVTVILRQPLILLVNPT